MRASAPAGSGHASTEQGTQPRTGRLALWLNHDRRECTMPADEARLLDVLAAHGIAFRLETRAWQDPALAGEPLLIAVDALVGPLEVVRNGALAAVGVTHLRVQPGDEVVIGQPDYLRRRFAFFR